MADLEFSPGGGAPTPKVGVLIYYFCRKLHENERIWTPEGARVPGVPPLDPPMELKNIHTLSWLSGFLYDHVLRISRLTAWALPLSLLLMFLKAGIADIEATQGYFLHDIHRDRCCEFSDPVAPLIPPFLLDVTASFWVDC